MFRSLSLASLVLVGGAAGLAAQGHDHEAGGTIPPGATVPLYDNLGTLHREIITSNPLVQRYFDQGLRLTYGFNHAEAIAAYRQAIALDSACAMCWWGVAWALGPNINAGMDAAAGAEARGAAQVAMMYLDRASLRDAALIRAMAQRYALDPVASRPLQDSAYAWAMAGVADRFPDDDDAQVLDAEAHMLLSPWNYWTAGGKPRPGTNELLARLKRVLDRNPNHPGACHFYIHAVEAAHPERAIACAERLPGLMPGAGHLVHMPGHIYIRVGRYADAIVANQHAVHADEAYIDARHPEGMYPLAYYPHNYHFLGFAAQMAGQRATAVAAARAVARVDSGMMRTPGLETLQHFSVTPYRVWVRFGMWPEILAEPLPAADLPYARGVAHWARGLARVATGDTAAAREELAALRRAVADSAVAGLTIWNINSAKTILEIGERMLVGELAGAAGDRTAQLDALSSAVALEDGLTYDEPPTWELPVRHYLGAAQLAAGQAGAAERTYRRDLERFPENGWALFGLARALEAQGKSRRAAAVGARLATAWATADVKLTASRF